MKLTNQLVNFADLHRHLDGSLRPSTIEELSGAPVPPDLRFHAGMGLPAALSKFAFTLSLLQTPAAVRRVAAEICEDAAGDGVTTLEIRFAPQLHQGAPLEAIVEAAVDGAAGRATHNLCALYGEAPSLVEKLVELAPHGIDLAGGPAPAHAYGLDDYAPAFRRARDRGLGRTVHAGEGRPAAEIGRAVERLHAERIGHGTTLLDDPRVVELVLQRGVTIEACITSNVHTGAIAKPSHHPLARWLALGVRACVNTDNTLLSACTSSSEHALAATLPGMTSDLLQRAVENGHAAAFARSSN
jgi:adenosine deaminase